MDAYEFVGSSDDGIDAFVEHPALFEFAGDDAHAIGLLRMLRESEVFGHVLVICDEHVRTSPAPEAR
jgi:hypothetical protein